MSILIHGVEMPTMCCDCKMYVEDVYCCCLLNREIENPWADDGVELDCPLVPVPPHGRLIDADALTAHFEKIADIEWNKKAAPISWSYAFEDVMDDIENAPTIIPADPAEEVDE